MIAVETWHRRIKASATERRPHELAWRKQRDAIPGPNYRSEDGEAKPKGSPANVANSFSRVLLPRLVPRNCKFEVLVTPKRPNTPEANYSQSAAWLTAALNAILDETKATNEIRRAAKAALYSAGILKVIHHVRTGTVAQANAAGNEQQPVDVDRERLEGRPWVKADFPCLIWVPATRFYPDPRATCMADASWAAHRIFRSVAALEADPEFAPFRGRWKATHRSPPRLLSEDEQRHGQDDAGLELVELWEIYDRDANRVLTIPGEASQIKEPVREAAWPAGVEGLPFVMITFDEVEGFFWPVPGMNPYWDAMFAANDAASHILEQASTSKTIVAYEPQGPLGPEHIARIANAKDGECVPVPGLGGTTQQITFGQINPSHMRAFEIAMQLADQMSGIGEFQRGGSPQSPRATATEVSARLQAGTVRMDDWRGAVNDAACAAVQILAALLVANREVLANVALPSGRTETGFVELGGDALVGEALEYAYEIQTAVADKVEPAIGQKRKQDLIEIGTNPAVVQKLAAEGCDFRIRPLIESLVQSLGEPDPKKFLVDAQQQAPPADPAAQAEDQQMLQTGQPLPTNADDDHQAHLTTHQADYAQSQSEAIAAHMMAHEAAMQGGPPAPAGPQPGTAGMPAGQAGQLAALQQEARP